jgi:hypothetical protein
MSRWDPRSTGKDRAESRHDGEPGGAQRLQRRPGHAVLGSIAPVVGSQVGGVGMAGRPVDAHSITARTRLLSRAIVRLRDGTWADDSDTVMWWRCGPRWAALLAGVE